jgi:hypothetical protein
MAPGAVAGATVIGVGSVANGPAPAPAGFGGGWAGRLVGVTSGGPWPSAAASASRAPPVGAAPGKRPPLANSSASKAAADHAFLENRNFPSSYGLARAGRSPPRL